MRRLLPALGLACWLAAAVVGHAEPTALGRAAAVFVRPVVLPFLWHSLDDAATHGDPQEAFARSQLLLAALPGWTDGQVVFAWRYALDGGEPAASAAARARAAAERLQTALLVLEAARASCRRDEADLLTAMGWLVELAARNEPGIAAHLPRNPVVLADALFAEAEGKGAGRLVREYRLFESPRLVAALLAAGDRDRALQVVAAAIDRCAMLREPELAVDWQRTLRQVQRALQGDPTVDRAALRADERLLPLAPFLR